MKKIIKLTETELNKIIQKIIKEQAEDQYMKTESDPEQMAGGIEDDPGSEGGEPSYDEFLQCAQGLLDQGMTVGNLVDKLIENQGGGEEEVAPEEEPLPEPEPETNPATDQKLAESRKTRKSR